MDYKHLINQFENLHKELVELVNKVPFEEREVILFDKWSLKDVLAHIIAWNDLNVSRVQAVIEGKMPANWVNDEDLDQFNEVEVDKRKNMNWDTIYNDFVASGYRLIDIFASLPDGMWDKSSGKGNRYSPKSYLYGMIDHYENEHIPQLKRYLKLI